MALKDDHWNKIQEAIRIGTKDSTVIGEMQALLLFLRDNWDLLSSKSKLTAHLKAERLKELKATQAAAEATAADAAAEISALEGRG